MHHIAIATVFVLGLTQGLYLSWEGTMPIAGSSTTLSDAGIVYTQVFCNMTWGARFPFDGLGVMTPSEIGRFNNKNSRWSAQTLYACSPVEGGPACEMDFTTFLGEGTLLYVVTAAITFNWQEFCNPYCPPTWSLDCFAPDAVTASTTSSATVTRSPSQTPTSSRTPSISATSSVSSSLSSSSSRTSSPSRSSSPSASPSGSSSRSYSSSSSRTSSISTTRTASPTSSASASSSATSSISTTRTASPTSSASASSSRTPSTSLTPSNSPTPSVTPSVTALPFFTSAMFYYSCTTTGSGGIHDFSGNNRGITATGSPTCVQDASGRGKKVLSFDGASYFQVTGDFAMTDFSLTAWTYRLVNDPSTNADPGIIGMDGSYGAGDIEWGFTTILIGDPTQRMKIRIQGANPQNPFVHVFGNYTVWDHYAWTFDSGTKTDTIYLNGTQVYQASRTGYTSITGPYFVGTNDVAEAGSGEWYGFLDEVGAFNTTLTQGNVVTVMNSRVGAAFSDSEVPPNRAKEPEDPTWYVSSIQSISPTRTPTSTPSQTPVNEEGYGLVKGLWSWLGDDSDRSVRP